METTTSLIKLPILKVKEEKSKDSEYDRVLKELDIKTEEKVEFEAIEGSIFVDSIVCMVPVGEKMCEIFMMGGFAVLAGTSMDSIIEIIKQ